MKAQSDDGFIDSAWDEWHGNSSEDMSNYCLWVNYRGSVGSGAMLPNSQMTIETTLVDKTNDYREVSDYKLEIITQSNFGHSTVTDNGKNLVINSNDRIGGGFVYVSVQMPDGNGGYAGVFNKDLNFSVS